MPYTPDQYTNYGSSSVAGGAGGRGTSLQPGDTTLYLPVGDGAKFPQPSGGMTFRLQISPSDIAKVTGRASDTLTLVRANGLPTTDADYNSATPPVAPVGTAAQLVVTAASMVDLWTAINQERFYNVMDYGAKLDGTTDDTTAIQNALNACPAGGTVFLPLGTGPGRTSAPLTVPPGVTVLGQIGRRADALGTEVVVTPSIKPLVSFGGVACLLFVDKEQGGYAADNNGIRLRHLALDGSALLAAPAAPAATGNTGAGSAFTAGQTANVAVTYVTAGGETAPSPSTLVTIGANGNNIVVTLPAFPAGVTGMNIYVSTASGSATLYKTNAGAGATSTASGGTVTITGFAPNTNSAPPVGTVAALQASGKVHDVLMENVSFRNFTGAGIQTANYTRADTSVQHPYSWTMRQVIANNCGGVGFNLNGTTDSDLTEVEALGCGSHGFQLTSMANSHFTGCRAEWSGGHGYYVTGNWLNAQGSGGASFVGCSTDRNKNNGVLIDATGAGPLVFTGHQARRDGRNGGTGGGGYAGIAASGCTMPIVIDGLAVYPGVDDNGTGTNSPDYAASFANCTSVDLNSGYLHAQVGGVNDGGGNTVLRLGPNLGIATGSTASPTRQTNYSWSFRDSLDVQQHALGLAQPREHSLVAWTFDPAHVSSGKAGVAGTVYLAAVYVHRAVSVSKILWGINTAGATPTAGQNFVGLYNSAGTLLASTGVDASVTATGLVTTTIASTALTPGLYWVAFVFNATTMPQVYRGQDLNATLMNVGIGAAASYRFATNGAAQTTLPATITPANNAVAQFAYWAALG